MTGRGSHPAPGRDFLSTRLIERLLRVSRFSDSAERFRAENCGFVGLALLASTGVALAVLAAADAAAPGTVTRIGLSLTLGTIGLYLLPLVTLRLGHVRLSVLLLLAIVYGSVTAGTWLGGPVPNPAAYGYLLVVAAAAVLLRSLAASAVGIGCLVTVAWIAWVSPPRLAAPAGGLQHLGVLTGVAAITVAIVVRMSERAHQAISSAVTQQRTLEQANRDLSSQEARFETIARNSGELVTEFDEAGRVVYASPNHRHVLGRDPDELLGRTATELVHPLEAGDDSPWPLFDDDPRTPHPFRIRAGDGSWRWCEITASDYVASDGRRRVVAVARDATTRVAAAAREARLRDAASHAQKMEALGRLAGGITHELNNLMTVITLNVELLTSSGTPDVGANEQLNHIRQSAEHATSLIRRLLAFARPTDGARTSVEVDPQVRDTAKLLAPLVGETIRFDLRLGAELGFVEADATQMGQLLMNLVVNARDALGQGGEIRVETRRVEVREPISCHSGPLPPGSYIGISVADSGAGMNRETRERLFEPFFTTRSGDGGTGLGLALVYAIVRRAGGDLSVESRPGEGTRIEAFLPRIDPPPVEPEPRAGERPERGGSETVLVVEDQEHVRAATASVVRSLGYRVLEAESGQEALEIQRHPDVSVDLLLTDVVMPGMSGPELAKRLLAERPEIRVLYLTGFADRAFGPDGSPDHAMLIKPVGRRVLAARMRALLDRGSAARSAPAGAAAPGAPAAL